MVERDYETDAGRPNVWKRGLIMLLFAIAFQIAQFVLNLLAVVQFLWLLFTGGHNAFVQDFGASLSIWIGDTVRFLTGVTEEKPFPWRDWP